MEYDVRFEYEDTTRPFNVFVKAIFIDENGNQVDSIEARFQNEEEPLLAI